MMKCFRNSFNPSAPADAGEVKAILFALVSCFIFIGFLTAFQGRSVKVAKTSTRIRVYAPPPPEMPVPPLRVPDAPSPPDMNARFREVPPNFRGIDFATRSYGNYEFSNGTNRELVLVDGQFREFGNSQQNWFDLNDVVYTDLTGDGSPEAIVLLTHLECGRMCDGGKNLVYIYSQNHPLQEILKYESGSGIEGCSLKSLTVKNRQLTLDLFGKCPPPSGIIDDFIQRETYDLTRVEFFFNGKQLVPKKKTVLTLPNRGEVSYGVEVRIDDKSSPLAQQPANSVKL
jgi:hypothetical protein